MDMILEQFKTIFDRPEKVKRLRETILDLAVKGKLVEQDPNDEAASVLLERIREEKERLIKEKKIKKDNIDDRMLNSGNTYILPEGWTWSKLINIGYSQTGTTPSKKNQEFFGGNIPFIKPADITDNGINYKNESLTREGLKAGRKIEDNSLLMVCIGTIGKAYFSDRVVSCNQQINALTCLGGISAKFIYYFTQSKNFKDKIKSLATGTTMLIVNKSKFDSVEIPIPPLEEQKRIVEKVDLLMTFCDKLENTLEKKVHYGELSAKSVFNAVGNVSTAEELEETLKFILLNFKDLSLGDNAVKELKNCILQLAVQGKLVPQDPKDEPAEVLLEKIREEKERLIKEKKIKKQKNIQCINENEMFFDLPRGWEFCKLGNVVDIVRGASPRPKGSPLYWSNSRTIYHWITIADITKYCRGNFLIDTTEFLTESGSKLSRHVKKGEIIIAVSGSTVGKAAITNIEGYIYDGLAAFKYVYNEILRDYIYMFLMAWRNEINSKSEGSAFPNINTDKLNNLVLPIPPLEEQKRIVEKVDSLMELCNKLEKRIEKQREYSNRLMESVIRNYK